MPAISPRTQGMANPGVPNDQAKTLFDQGLSQMAYSVLLSKLPSVSADVVTFKVLESNPEEGSGIGAFVVMRRNQPLYIPVVMAENQIKPLDLVFCKQLNVFIPLTKEWLAEIDKASLDELGQGVKAPDTLSTDVDIRNTVVPPTTGRYSYAEEQAYCVVDEARNQTGEVKTSAFLEFLSNAPNRVKTAVAQLFETRPLFLKQAVHFYGAKSLLSALQVKVAGKVPLKGGALYIADKSTDAGAFKDLFGDKATAAFQEVRAKGYYAKDDRKSVKRALAVQPFLDLKEPKEAGVYKLWTQDGEEVLAFVSGNPIRENPRKPAENIRFRAQNAGPAAPGKSPSNKYRAPGSDGERCEHFRERYVGITEKGVLIDTDKLIGVPRPSGELEKVLKGVTKNGLRGGAQGFFLQRSGSSFIATVPMRIEEVTTGSDGVKRARSYSPWDNIVLNSEMPGKIVSSAAAKTLYVPSDCEFISGERSYDQHFLGSPEEVMRFVHDTLVNKGAEKVAVYHRASDDRYVVDRADYDFVGALRKVAETKNISVEDAAFALKQASLEGKYAFWALDSTKLAASDSKPKEKAPEQDPAQAAMDQVTAAQMAAPQGPSPVDMAVAEQMQLLQMQQQSLAQQMQMLQNVQNRANMIGGTGGAQANPAAAAAAMGGPVDPSMMGAGAPIDPSMGGGMDPSMQQPQMSGGMQQPQMGGGMQQPQMGGGMQQPQMGGGMDPSMQQQQEQPPMAMMNADDGSIDSLAAQVNPQFAEQAGSLNDAGAFDAAALASMAQSPSLKDLVGAYLPNLEKALDNMGRVLLSLWMDESKIKGDVGDTTYIALEDTLRSTFKGMGDLILKVNQNQQSIRAPNDSAYMRE